MRLVSTLAVRFSPAKFSCVCTESKKSWIIKSKLSKEERTQDREVRDSRKVEGFMTYRFQWVKRIVGVCSTRGYELET